MFQRKWLLPTLLVLAGTALCIRLGIWQLDRLEQRRAFNTHFEESRALPALDLNQEQPENLGQMEWRLAQVTGEYDFENQVAVRNQYYGSEYGYHLITPLRFGDAAILVDRGWIPAESNDTPADWHKYDETGPVTATGQLRLGNGKPRFGGVADPPAVEGVRLEVWNNVDLTRIADQIPYPVLPVYLQPDPIEGDTEPPIPFQPDVQITEGSHFGYALQWFTFATILFFGYPFYVHKQDTDSK